MEEPGEETPLVTGQGRRSSSLLPDDGSVDLIVYADRVRRKLGTLNFWERKCPVLSWLPNYSYDKALGDFIAGLTVGLTAIPQAIAYATLAGLSPEHGLYSAFMGCFVYAVFGSVKDVTIGPTAILSLMTNKYVTDHGPEYAVILCFSTGVIVLVFGLMNLGFVVNFISTPVTVGFTSAAAVTIIISQIPSLLGLKLVQSTGNDFLATLEALYREISNTKGYDFLMGEIAIILLLFLKLVNDKYNNVAGDAGASRKKSILRKGFWFICTARNFLIVVLCGAIAELANRYSGQDLISLSVAVPSGIPVPSVPPFSLPGNATTPGQNYASILSTAGWSLLVLPLIAIVESIAIAKAFSFGTPVDASQEMIALGLSNVLGSFFQSMPTTGSFSRTAINHASGVRTQFGGIYTGILVLSSLVVLTPLVPLIPKTALAAVIITALIYMVDYRSAVHILKSRKIDFVPFLATFLSCIFLGLEFGVLIGVVVDVLILLYYSARPELSVSIEEVSGCRFILVLPDRGLFFPAHQTVRDKILSSCSQITEQAQTFLFDLTNTHDIDYSVAKFPNCATPPNILQMFDAAIKDLHTAGHRVMFASVQRQIRSSLMAVMSPEYSGNVKFFISLEHFIQHTSRSPDDF
ncbi:unnamed protein product [Notodromas monacha]|uniref:SLC26A/SulP transporter domain-containing protein n=1 Tax=Notodromas monacha TaxID=399045 RepID=A0A7R9BN48_9CRUS|nr:unnamed protein product [Notodromas monacha]CAG0917739.1 unnamed protein product [Notodromas monacha]